MNRTIRNWRGFLVLGLLVSGVLLGAALVPGALAYDTKATPPPDKPTKPPVETQPQPTKADVPPTDVPPTKAALPTGVPPTKTPWPTVSPTKTLLPTSTPSGTPSPTIVVTDTTTPTPVAQTLEAAARSAGASTSGPAQPGAAAAATSLTTAAAVPATVVTGVVFDDANDNGRRDPGEVGLSGVAVSVAPCGPPPRRVPQHAGDALGDGGHGQTATGQQTVVTDASGVYTLPANTAAQVRVNVPAGWRTRRPDSFPITQTGDFPLHATATTPDTPTALTPLTITQSVIDFAPLITLGLALGAVLAIGFLRLARAVSTSNRQLALVLVRMQRTSEKPLSLDEIGAPRATDARVLALLNQAGLDASGQPPQIERVLSVTNGEAPAIIALGQAGRAAFVVFTPLEAKTFRRLHAAARLSGLGEVAFEHATAYPLDRLDEALAAGHTYPLDALSSGLFVADDLAAAYHYLAADLPVSARTLPRVARWTLWVAPVLRHDLAVRAGWRQRLSRWLHS